MKIKEFLTKFKGHLIVALAGVGALIAAITPITMDEELGSKYSPEFKEAFERGAALQGSVTPTTVPPAPAVAE